MIKRKIKAILLFLALIFTLTSCNMLSFISQGRSSEPIAPIFASIDENAETPSTDLIESELNRFTHKSAVEIYTSFAQIDYKTKLSLEEITAFLNEKIEELGAVPFESQEGGLPENVLWYYGGSYHNNSAPINVLVEQDGELLHIYISLY